MSDKYIITKSEVLHSIQKQGVKRKKTEKAIYIRGSVKATQREWHSCRTPEEQYELA